LDATAWVAMQESLEHLLAHWLAQFSRQLSLRQSDARAHEKNGY
jgi:hypothetical protein